MSKQDGRVSNFQLRYFAKQRCRKLNFIVQRLKENAPVGTEGMEWWCLRKLVWLWKNMKAADAEGRKRYVELYGLSIAELDAYGREYIERVKVARVSGTARFDEKAAGIVARKKLFDYMALGATHKTAPGSLAIEANREQTGTDRVTESRVTERRVRQAKSQQLLSSMEERKPVE